MKRLLATTAIATMAFAGTASAQANQSLLQRVLTDLQNVTTTNLPVTGIFANTADNLFAGAAQNTVALGGVQTTTTADRTLQIGDVITFTTGGNQVTATVGTNGALLDSTGTPIVTISVTLGAPVLTNGVGVLTVADGAFVGPATTAVGGTFTVEKVSTTTIAGTNAAANLGIDASVLNVLNGLTGPTAVTAGGATATEAVDAILGNIATTALGAVNTGDIQLIGSNLSFSEDIDTATAGTSMAVQQMINNTVTQVGTTTGQTVLALNSALNETNVNASVTNVTTGVNSTIGRSGFETAFAGADFATISGLDAAAISALTGGISTTGLGAVNTGTIISGANNQVNGVISSIVGSNAATSTTGG
jgi:hypothetical protein